MDKLSTEVSFMLGELHNGLNELISASLNKLQGTYSRQGSRSWGPLSITDEEIETLNNFLKIRLRDPNDIEAQQVRREFVIIMCEQVFTLVEKAVRDSTRMSIIFFEAWEEFSNNDSLVFTKQQLVERLKEYGGINPVDGAFQRVILELPLLTIPETVKYALGMIGHDFYIDISKLIKEFLSYPEIIDKIATTKEKNE